MALPAFALACIPSGCMLLFTLVGLGVHCPEALAGALQHFAAGILLCTIGTELLPALDLAAGVQENVAACAGFFAGVAVMLALGILLPEHDDDDDSDDEEAAAAGKAGQATPPPRRLNGRGESKKRMSFRLASAATGSGVGERQPLRQQTSLALVEKAPFPAVLLFAIAVDGAMDGLLIGIATAAGPSAGPMLATSLSVEMAFLGLTLSMGLKGQGRLKSVAAACVGPLGIVLGATLGGVLADALRSNPLYLTGLLSFGTSALLFMVAEELLLEAHEKGDHVWWVDLQLYTGFYASIVMGKVLG